MRFRRREAAAPAAPDPVAFFSALARDRVGAGYGAAARRRDFRRVFLESAAGRRVLWQVFDWARLFHPASVPGDPYATHFRDGEHNLGLRILAALEAAPAAGPPDAAAGEDEEDAIR